MATLWIGLIGGEQRRQHDPGLVDAAHDRPALGWIVNAAVGHDGLHPRPDLVEGLRCPFGRLQVVDAERAGELDRVVIGADGVGGTLLGQAAPVGLLGGR